MGEASVPKTERLISDIVIALGALAFLSLLVWWFLVPLPFQLKESLPGEDNKPAGAAETADGGVVIGEYFQGFSGKPSALPGSWPRFRGANADNISREPFTVPSPFSSNVRWSIPLGEGHAAPAVAYGRVFILDYDEARKSDALRCFSLETGEEIWRRWYRVPLKRNHGISRSIPTVSGNRVVSMGPRGQVMCVDAATGAFRWGIDVEREFKTEIPQWYTAQCPLVDGGEAVIATGGDALLIGVDLETGKINWQTPNQANLRMSHSSVIPMTLNGKRIFLYSAVGGLAGVSAEKADRGRLLFIHKEWDNSVVAPSPVPFPDGRVFLAAGYGAGSMLVRITEHVGAYSVSTLYRYRPKEGLASEQQTPILSGGLLYGVMPKDGGNLKNQFVCFNPDTQKILWATGKTLTFGLGPFILADGTFLILSDDGILSALRADAEGFRLIGQAPAIPKARDAWGPIAVAGKLLLLRDATRLFCVELGE